MHFDFYSDKSQNLPSSAESRGSNVCTVWTSNVVPGEIVQRPPGDSPRRVSRGSPDDLRQDNIAGPHGRYNKTTIVIPSSHIGFLVASICIWLYLISFDFNVIVLDVV